MKARALLSVAALALLPAGALAQELSYSYFDLQYFNNGIDESITVMEEGEDLTLKVEDDYGFGARASWGFLPNWHVFATYSKSDADLRLAFMDESMKIGGDVTDWRVGFGGNYMLTSKLSGYVQVSWDDRDVDFGTLEVEDFSERLAVDDDGFGAKVGLRGLVTDRFELNGHIRYSDVGGMDLGADDLNKVLTDNTFVGAGGEYRFTDNFSLCAEVETGEDVTSWGLFARLNFGG